MSLGLQCHWDIARSPSLNIYPVLRGAIQARQDIVDPLCGYCTIAQEKWKNPPLRIRLIVYSVAKNLKARRDTARHHCLIKGPRTFKRIVSIAVVSRSPFAIIVGTLARFRTRRTTLLFLAHSSCGFDPLYGAVIAP